MARTPLTANILSRDGDDLVTVLTDAVNGNSVEFDPSGEELLFSFFSPIPCTVTILTPLKVDETLNVDNRVLVLTPGTVKLWFCEDAGIYRQDDGSIYFDSTVSCSVGLYIV